MKVKIYRFKTAKELAKSVADNFAQTVQNFVKEGENLNVALSGGNTPRILFESLAQPAYGNRINWNHIHFFWGDERCVPPDDPQSNYGLAYKSLLSHISIPDKNIHRIKGENDPILETNRYAEEICGHVLLGEDNWPVFDWILLGLGTDGHTASLFPKTPELEEQNSICVVTTHPETGQKRVSLTLPVINHARRISFLVTGESKTAIVRAILKNESGSDRYPASQVKPIDGMLEWFLDEIAASKLEL